MSRNTKIESNNIRSKAGYAAKNASKGQRKSPEGQERSRETALATTSRRMEWLLGLALIVATILAYQQTWHAGFIWDDDAHVTRNPCIVGELGFKGIWTTSAATYYPLVLSSFWVLKALWGLNPFPFHLFTVLMHAASALLLWRVLHRLHTRGAWLGAAIWSLHPVMVESAAWITELKNTQSCFFFLLAILLFIKWREAREVADRRAGGLYALVLLCSLLAVLSKSSTVILPVVLGLCWWWLDGRWRWRNAGWLSPFLAISLAASAWTIWEQKYHSGALGPEWNQSLPERVAIAGKVIWFYLGKLLWPHPLVFVYPRWQIDISNPTAYLPALAAAVGLLLLWLNRKGSLTKPSFFAAAYFLTALFPVLGFFNVYFFRYSFVGDHLQYLASIGPIALAAAGMDKVFGFFRQQAPFARPVASGILLCGLGLLSWLQGTQYANAETLFRTTIERNPSCWMAYNNLGMLELDRSAEAAMGHFEEALRLKPDDPEAHNNMGNALRRVGRYNDALEHHQAALRLKPDFAEAYNNLGVDLQRLGRMEEAAQRQREALRLKPDLAVAHYNLGSSLQALGRSEEAVGEYNEALRLNAGLTDVYSNLGIALMELNRIEESRAAFENAVRLKPEDAGAHFNLGNVLIRMGRENEAVAEYTYALRYDPGSAKTHNNLGSTLFRLGRLEEAVIQFKDALQIRPDYPEARANLDRALDLLNTPQK